MTYPYVACLSLCLVEGRLYTESMTGATAASKPKASKLDEKELSRLRTQDYWLQITRAKLLMDLIFVCASISHYRGQVFVTCVCFFPQLMTYFTFVARAIP